MYQERISGRQRNERESKTVIPIILSSDKTVLGNLTGANAAWPVYMGVGNVTGAARFHTDNMAFRLVALLPLDAGMKPHLALILMIGFRADEIKSEKFKDWKRGMLHDVLHQLLLPLQRVMEDGVNLRCPDGHRRHCFPVMAQYLADYEEQRFLACILSHWCPKCLIAAHKPTGPEDDRRPAPRSSTQARSQARRRGSRQETALDVDEDQAPVFVNHQNPATYRVGMQTYPRRDGDEAKRLRAKYDGVPRVLRLHGYHFTHPFSEHHIYGDIYDALQPDTLHQVLKCSFDYLHDWHLNIIDNANQGGLAGRKKGEIDARFSNIPPYPGVRPFLKGINTISRWQGNEIRAMMKVYIGIIDGLVPPACLALTKTYLDILRMAQYESHTDSTLEDFGKAINQFWIQLWDPNGPYCKHTAKVHPGYFTPKLHYFQHYVDTVKQHGSLQHCSTNRTEGMHKEPKNAWSRSNKTSKSRAFMLRDEGRRLGWRRWDIIPKETQPEIDRGVRHKFLRATEYGGTKTRHYLETKVFNGRDEYVELWSELSRYLRWRLRGSTGGIPRRREREEDEQEWGVFTIKAVSLMNVYYPEVHDPDKMRSETLHSQQQFEYYQNSDWCKERRDTALFRYGRDEVGNSTMGNRRVGRLLLLFSMQAPWDTNETLKLAYVQWFETVMQSQTTGMFKVRKRRGFEVVDIATIERGVHLIPCFQGVETAMARPNSVLPLDRYSDFWVNNQVDMHMYNTIY
jgi:hypothetical protein